MKETQTTRLQCEKFTSWDDRPRTLAALAAPPGSGSVAWGRPGAHDSEESTMARMKFLCDAERCIECNSCVTACKQEHDIPWGVNRRRVVTLNDGVPGERSISVACMHCSDAPCMAVCPVDCFYKTEEG